MKTILVPVDFSKNSENALHFAINLSQKLQAQLILFHSFHTFHSNAYGSAKSFDKDALFAKNYSDQELKELYDNAGIVAFSEPEYISSQNELRDEILRLVAEKNVDLIVMGTQGSGNRLEGQIFGTNTSWVVEKAPCPVITTHENLQLETLSNIVYATDYMSGDCANLQKLAQIAQAFSAHITVIHIAKEESAEALTALNNFEQRVKAETGLSNLSFNLLKGNNVEKSLEQYLADNQVDLLVLSAHHHTLTEKLLGKSVTKNMTLYTDISLMIFHQKAN
ncbi:universal stress protein [Spirosoma sp. SC4-14]|uniref:universal stress protein n=1 Tax=Spirosoma sp. SC4-14 TaxID=3128900 RepID=UPI0030D3C6B1